MKLRIHAIVPVTEVNGPGKRFGLWVQGCNKRCVNCYNPEAQDNSGGYEVEVSDIVSQIERTSNIEGVSISGGEPFEQSDALLELALLIKKKTNLTLLIFTSLNVKELQKYKEIVDLCDQIVLNHNHAPIVPKTDTKPYVQVSYSLPQDIELHIDKEGNLTITGFPSEEDKSILIAAITDG